MSASHFVLKLINDMKETGHRIAKLEEVTEYNEQLERQYDVLLECFDTLLTTEQKMLINQRMRAEFGDG